MKEEKIDFVLIWVDGNDEAWQKEKAEYTDLKDKKVDNQISRYRDWEILKYWFRGVEKFAPWVNNIYFVTCGHYPKWLNLNHPKLRFVKHEDYIPHEYLPTFNSHTIELNLHRIKGLSEKFVYFNDDTLLTNNVSINDFYKNDKPRYIAACDYIYGKHIEDAFAHILLNNASIINKYFNKKDVIRKNWTKWYNINNGAKFLSKTIFLSMFKMFSALADPHLPSAMLKSTYEELWEKETELLQRTSKSKFRSMTDVNQYLFKWYDIARGNFEPFCNRIGRDFITYSEKEELLKSIKNQKYKMICFSDDIQLDFEKVKIEVQEAFEKILPEKSKFEL